MPPRLFIKPRGDGISESSIISLPHPKTGVPTRYLLQSATLHSITRISTPHLKRSLFVGDSILSDGMIYIATPEDTLFHILPHIKKLTARHSLPLQDILDLLPRPLSAITQAPLIESICDRTESSNSLIPHTYKLSMPRVLQILLRKVDALAPVLGESIVNEFVEKPLTPILGQPMPGDIAEIRNLARRKCAFDLIASNIDNQFTQLLQESTDFTPLTTYLSQLEKARADAILEATLSIQESCASAKRVAIEDPEPEKKKQKVSKGVKALEKVNTRGMKDMRTFFKKPVKTQS